LSLFPGIEIIIKLHQNSC